MLESQTQELLLTIYRRENVSFLQYLRDASPWVAPDDRTLADRLQEIALNESKATVALGEYLQEQRVLLPNLGTFPTRFTSYNFMNLRKLVPVLIQDHRQQIEYLEGRVNDSTGEPQSIINCLIDLKRKHLHELST